MLSASANNQQPSVELLIWPYIQPAMQARHCVMDCRWHKSAGENNRVEVLPARDMLYASLPYSDRVS
jgi:hypothetical protein